MQFDHALFKILPLVIMCVLTICRVKPALSVGAKFDCCRPHSLSFGYC